MRRPHRQAQSGPVIVGVDGSERSAEALALADLLGPALGRPVVIAYVHPYGRLSDLLSENEYEVLVREVAELTFDQIREHLPSVPERRMQLISDKSPAAGLHALAEREAAALIVIGSSHRSNIGRILVGGTGERLLSGASAPVAVAPAGYTAAARGIQLLGCGFDGPQEARRALAWAAQLARTASARLRVLSVHEATLPASLAVGGGLATASINDILRRERQEERAHAVAALDPDIDASERSLDGDAPELLARESGELDLLVVGSPQLWATARRAARQCFQRADAFGAVAARRRSAPGEWRQPSRWVALAASAAQPARSRSMKGKNPADGGNTAIRSACRWPRSRVVVQSRVGRHLETVCVLLSSGSKLSSPRSSSDSNRARTTEPHRARLCQRQVAASMGQ